MVRQLLAAMVIALGSACALGQPLADRVPGDAIVYIGWQGADAMPPAYAESHLKAVVETSNFGALVTDLLPRLIASASKNNPQASQAMQLVKTFGAPLWRHPSAIYFSGIDFKAAKGPKPRAAVLCQAGAEADALLAQIKPLAEMTKDAPYPLRAFKRGDILVLAIGCDQDADALAGGAGSALAANPRFQEAQAQVKGDAIAMAYVDGEAAVALVGQGMTAMAPPGEAENWNKARQTLGLDGLRRIVIAGGFDGPNWSTRMFIGASGPRKGLLALLESQPLSDETLKLIPQSAAAAGVERLDLAGLFDMVREIVGQFEPAARQQFDGGVGMVNQTLGFDLRNDLLAAFGNEWAFYAIPAGNAADPMGLVLVNRLSKPAEAEKSLGLLEDVIKRAAGPQMRAAGFSLQQNKVGQLTVHTIRSGVTPISPSWTIKDGRLFLTLSSQGLPDAVQRAGQGPSILDNAAFADLRKKLGGEKAMSLSFADLPKTAAVLYPQFLEAQQIGLAAARLAGIQPPASVLPSQQRLMEHLNAAAGFTWIDEAGWHSQSLSPFPGSTLLSPNSNMATVGSAALGVSILLPALNAAKERANRVKCASNLRQIAQGTMLWANDHRGRYPAEIGMLVKDADLNPEVFICPSGPNSLPAAIRNGTIDQKAKWATEQGDYVWLGAKLNAGSPADLILAYEKPDDHDRQGINMVFNDGHVEWVLYAKAMDLIRKQQGSAPVRNAAPGATGAGAMLTPGAGNSPPSPAARANVRPNAPAAPDASGRMPAGNGGIKLTLPRDGKPLTAAPADPPPPAPKAAAPADAASTAAPAQKNALDSAAVAQGKLSLADSYFQSGAKAKAQAVYQAIIRDYPNTPAAAEAKKKLAEIK